MSAIAQWLPVLIATGSASQLLMGCTLTQSYFYIRRFGHDPIHLKAAVVLLSTLDVIHEVFIQLLMFQLLSLHMNEDNVVVALQKMIPRIRMYTSVSLVFIGQIVLLSLAIWAWRIWVVGRHRMVPALVLVMAITQAVMISILAVWSATHTDASFLQRLRVFGRLTWSFMAASDVFATAAMLYYLARSKTADGIMNNTINRVIAFTVNTNSLTAACSISASVAYVVGSTPWTVFFTAVAAKLHVFSILTSLLARDSSRFSGQRGHGRESSFRHTILSMAGSHAFHDNANHSSLRAVSSEKGSLRHYPLQMPSPVHGSVNGSPGSDKDDWLDAKPLQRPANLSYDSLKGHRKRPSLRQSAPRPQPTDTGVVVQTTTVVTVEESMDDHLGSPHSQLSDRLGPDGRRRFRRPKVRPQASESSDLPSADALASPSASFSDLSDKMSISGVAV